MTDENIEPEQRDYQSFLLRLWRVKVDGDSWRASLEDVQSREVQGFTDLEGVFAYLEELLEQASRGLMPDPEEVVGQ